MRREAKEDESFGVADFETDPFLAGRVPHPFAFGVYFGEGDYAALWESDSTRNFIERVVTLFSRLPPCTVYAHNGGRFDFHYLLEYAERGDIEIRENRVTKMRIGKVTLRDSFPIMPFALAEFRKTKIDYAIFERSRRNKPRNRKKIESYLFDDCRDLHELLTGFRKTVGRKYTIGGAAFEQMKLHGIEIPSLSESHDEMYRPYYFGGRVEAFKKGEFNGPLQYLDLNSAYPFAMRSNHPSGAEYECGSALPHRRKSQPYFARVIARSKGALPMRGVGGSLSFPTTERAEFFATGWEIVAGLETRTLEILETCEVWRPVNTITFRDYIDYFYARRQKAKTDNEPIKRLAYKYLLNSGYGKFAQNPRDFREYRLASYGQNVSGYEWETDFGDISLWSKPSYCGFGFFDVATSASITGYVRALLWRSIAASRGVLYADTDSIICRSSQLPMGNALGAWKREHAPDVHVTKAFIAGKKLYAVRWSRPDEHGQIWRVRSKGARLTWQDMRALTRGDAVEWENAAPTFSIGGAHFIRREIHAT